MIHLTFLVLTGNKSREGNITGMMKYELAGVSDKRNLKQWLKLLPGFLISLQGYRGKRKVS